MFYEDKFILQKEVNWSLLNHGFNLPISIWNMMGAMHPDILVHGTTRAIKILIDNEFFDATLTNVNFDKEKYPNHKDLIQIRYSSGSYLAKKLQTVFNKSYEYLKAKKQLQANQRKPIALPQDIHENFRFYFTENANVFCMECNTESDYGNVAHILQDISEEVYESATDDAFFLRDDSASIEEKQRIVKYRKIDKSIIDTLKKFYNYCDEISGEKIGSEYGPSVVEAHHIDYFTKSQNNDSTNIIIISPNYHRIIHRNNPYFNRKKFQFEFPNGEILPLKLYDHLKVG